MSKPAVIVISSHVARGSVGNRAAVFALETLGYPVWAIPTIQLAWHPGHGTSTRIVPPIEAFENFISDLVSSPWTQEVGAILTGYMANAEQVETVARMICNLKQQNPHLIQLCDPIIGDQGGLYVGEDVAIAIRDHLFPSCTIATPNAFEAAWLAGRELPGDLSATIDIARELSPKSTLITSCPAKENHQIGNLYVDDATNVAAFHDSIENPPNGPGDLTSALFLGHTLSGMTPEAALQRTTETVLEILIQSAVSGSNELTLAENSGSIRKPLTPVTLTRLDP